MSAHTTPARVLIKMAGKLGEVDGAASGASHYFLVVAWSAARNKYTVWAIPDRVRAIERAMRLVRVISQAEHIALLEKIYASRLDEMRPYEKSFTWRGMHAELMANLLMQNATLQEYITENVEDAFQKNLIIEPSVVN
jgi:hypothetical protein